MLRRITPVDRERIGRSATDVWHRRCLVLLATLFVARLVYALVVPLDLVHDEAYYWDWSRHLDWGYYSKPPGVAWLIALSCGLGADTAFFVRLPAVILGTGMLYGVFLLGRELYDSRVGFLTVLAVAATPGQAALSLIMTIDAPLIFCWTFALYSFWMMLHAERTATLWCVACTVATGLGLLSKQTMAALPVLALVFLLTERQYRGFLRRPLFWCYLLGALLFLTPVVGWNARHGWVTLQHTQGHFAPDPASTTRRIVRGLEFLAAQAGVATPILWGLLLVAAARLLWHRPQETRQRFLLWFSMLPLAGVVALSFRQRVEPNWPAPFYVAGAVLAGGYCLTLADPRQRLSAARWLRAGFALALAITAAAYASPFLLPPLGLAGTRFDPVVRLRGWQALGHEVGRSLAAFPAPSPSLVIVTTGRAEAAELAFYLPGQPTTAVWNDSGLVTSQYDFWPIPPALATGHVAIITPDQGAVPPALAARFGSIEDRGALRAPVGAGREHRIRLWRGTVVR